MTQYVVEHKDSNGITLAGKSVATLSDVYFKVEQYISMLEASEFVSITKKDLEE